MRAQRPAWRRPRRLTRSGFMQSATAVPAAMNSGLEITCGTRPVARAGGVRPHACVTWAGLAGHTGDHGSLPRSSCQLRGPPIWFGLPTSKRVALGPSWQPDSTCSQQEHRQSEDAQGAVAAALSSRPIWRPIWRPTSQHAPMWRPAWRPTCHATMRMPAGSRRPAASRPPAGTHPRHGSGRLDGHGALLHDDGAHGAA